MSASGPLQESGSNTAETRRLLSAALVAGLVAAALALLTLVWLGRDIVTGVTPAIDDYLRTTIHNHSSPGLTKVMIAASVYGAPPWLWRLGLVLSLAFFLRGWHRGSLLVIATLAGAMLLNGLLKHTFARARPAPFFDYPLPGSYSFPSGHALFAASFFGGLAVLVSGRVQSKRLRLAVWIVALGLILLIGFSRVYLGVHYPSDVFGGYAVATVWVAGITLADQVVSHRRLRRLA